MNRFITKDNNRAGALFTSDLSFAYATDAELKAISNDLPEGYVAGWASTPSRDHYDHVVEAGAFSEAIATKGLNGPKGIKLLAAHDTKRIAGTIKVLEYRGDRLWIEAQLNLNVSYVKDLYETLKMVGGVSFSVGFFLQDYAWEVNKDTKDEYLRIKKGDLFEVSIVSFPGNDDCSMEFVKDHGEVIETMAQFEKALVANGMCKTRTEAGRLTSFIKQHGTLFAQGKRAPVAPEPAPAPLLDADQANKIAMHLAAIKSMLSN